MAAIGRKSEALLKAEQQVLELQRAYHAIFQPESPVGKLILQDLAIFCRANQSTFNADPRIHALLEGRREVYQHIHDQLTLSSHELLARMLERSKQIGVQR